MSIYGNLPPVQGDVARTRQQQSDRLQKQRAETAQPNESTTTSSGSAKDSLDEGALRQVKELAAQVQQADHSSIHRLEDLRERIANGEYTAQPEELADILLPVLRGEHPLS
jgi:anti-sigma28 factor (negative regulator of flagellin synthesis)